VTPYFPYYKLYWDRNLLTEKIIHFNRPDLTLDVKINEGAACNYIAVPLIRSLQATTAEMNSQYQELQLK
jgi:hypothetical protein